MMLFDFLSIRKSNNDSKINPDLALLLQSNSEIINENAADITKKYEHYFKGIQLIRIIFFGPCFIILFFINFLNSRFHLINNNLAYFILVLLLSLSASIADHIYYFFIIYNISSPNNNEEIISLKKNVQVWRKNIGIFFQIEFIIFFQSLIEGLIVFIGCFLVLFVSFILILGTNFLFDFLLNINYISRINYGLISFITYISLFLGFAVYLINAISYPFTTITLIESLKKNTKKSAQEIVRENKNIVKRIGNKTLINYYMQRPFSIWNFKGIAYFYSLYQFIKSQDQTLL